MYDAQICTCLVETLTRSMLSRQSRSGFVALPPELPAPRCITSLTSSPFTSDMSSFASEGEGNAAAETEASNAAAAPSTKALLLVLLLVLLVLLLVLLVLRLVPLVLLVPVLLGLWPLL